jgi:hypothetical protein
VFGYGAIANANPEIPTGVPMSEAAFNTIWKKSPNEIIYRHCEDCSASHKEIYMRRTGDKEKNLPFDMLTMVLEDWFDTPNNILGTNFDLYDTYAHALAQTNKWAFCNYNDAGVGFPRDCGKYGSVGFNWNSIDRTTGGIKRGGKTNFYFAVETTSGPSASDQPSDPPEEHEQFFGDCKVSSAECSIDIFYSNELGDGYCNDYYPNNSKECCWDGGDCSRGLTQGAIVVIAIAVVILLCSCFSAVLHRTTRSRANNSTSTAQPSATVITAPPLTEEERTSQRRELILMSIIHKVSHKYLKKLIVITKTCIRCMILI